jgi:hypothetical protein
MPSAVLLAALALVPSGQAELLPDLISALPTRLAVQKSGGRQLLVFASAAENVGDGPLIVDGKRPSRTQGHMTTTQVVRTADGGTVRYPVPDRIRYVVTSTHQHWHFENFARYRLLSADNKPLSGRHDRKTGFCLGDRYRSFYADSMPSAPENAVYTSDCGLRSRKLLGLREGISVGFGDDYLPAKEGQSIDVTGLGPGTYVLVHEANPNRSLRETNYDNNGYAMRIELRRAGSGYDVKVRSRCRGQTTCPA